MSRYMNLTNGGRPQRAPAPEDPEAELVLLAGPRAAAVYLPDMNDWRAAVLIEDQWFIGRDAFETQEGALAVAVARARARMEGADGHQ